MSLAAERWRIALGTEAIKTDDSAEPLCRVEPMPEFFAEFAEPEGLWRVGNYAYALILLYPDVSSETFELAAMHEFGHALGLGHVSGAGIMSAVQGSEHLTAADAAEARRAGWISATPETP